MSLPMRLPRLASRLLLAKPGDPYYHFGANAAASIPVIQHSNVGASREYAHGTIQGKSFGNLRSTVCLLPKLSEILVITHDSRRLRLSLLPLRVRFRCRSGPNHRLAFTGSCATALDGVSGRNHLPRTR